MRAYNRAVFEYAVSASVPAAVLSCAIVALIGFAVGWFIGRRR